MSDENITYWQIDEIHVRRRIVLGFAFSNLQNAEYEQVKKFLKSGDTKELFGTRYFQEDYSMYYGKY